MKTFLANLECVKVPFCQFILIGFEKNKPKIYEITHKGAENKTKSFLGSGGEHANNYIDSILERRAKIFEIFFQILLK